MTDETFGIAEVVKRTGISRRTIRYYVQIELLEPPEGRGKGAYYREYHIKHLMWIKELKENGFSISTIKDLLRTSPDQIKNVALKQRLTWARFVIAPGIEVHLRTDIEQAHPKMLLRIVGLLKRIVDEDLKTSRK
jgi:DNA-binding transcriptional MerR regulator